MAHIDLNVRVILMEFLQAFGGGDDTHEFDAFAAVLLDEIHCFGAGASCGEHGIHYDNCSLVNGFRELAVILMRLVSYGIPVKTDVSHLGGGHESQDTVHHPKAGPQDGNHGHLFAGDHGRHAGFNRRLYLHIF